MGNEQEYQTAREVLEANDFMNIATATTDGDPWVVAVRLRGFIDGCLRWSSQPDRYHSKLIKQNPKIGFLIYDSTTKPEGVPTLALYGRAKVVKIEPDNIEGELYLARLDETWVLRSEKIDGQWRPKVQIDPVKIGNVGDRN